MLFEDLFNLFTLYKYLSLRAVIIVDMNHQLHFDEMFSENWKTAGSIQMYIKSVLKDSESGIEPSI